MDFGVIIAIIIVGAFLAWFINKRTADLANAQKTSPEILSIMKMLQDSSSQDRQVLLNSLQQNSQSLNERLDNAAKVIGDVQKNIGEMSEIGRGMKELQDFLRNPKLRGNIGEHILNELLAQILPKDSFHLQYAFKSGEKVDAAIKTAGGIIPIDSKFPMENFRKLSNAKTDEESASYEKLFIRDVKIHIDAISKKYILTDEGTIDYALMYIPAESMYYAIVNNGELFDYASDHRVLPVSPTTFYAYLRAILMSFEGQKIEAKAKEILSSLRAIQKDYGKVEENLTVLQKHMNNASSMFNNVMASFGTLGQKITQTKNLGQEVKEEVGQLPTG